MRRFFGKSALTAGCAAMVLALAAPALAGPGGHGGGGGGGGGGGPHGGGGGGGPHGGGGGGGPHGGGGGGGPHGGGGGGGPHGGGPHFGGGKGHGNGGGSGARFERHGGGGPHHGSARMGHGAERMNQRAWQGHGGQRATAMHGGRGRERDFNRQGHGGPAARAERFGAANGQRNGRGHGAGRMVAAGAAAAVGGAAVAGAIHGGRGPEGFAGRGEPDRVSFRGERPNIIGGCPPGLAKKYNGCNPPGLVRQDYVPWQADWWGYQDSGYRYFDGYLLRTSGPSILGYVPLLGGALYLGEPWPTAYETAPVPVYYRDYYDLGPDYRYYDDTFYRLDPGSDRIAEVAGFLTGDEFVVGQPMPIGYDVYNVPWDYRDRYADGPDAWYRYADGYVYRIDPKTMLILAAIQLLT